MTVRDVMTANVASVGPDASLKQVAELLVERGVSGVPVVDADRRVLGVVSEADIIVKAVTRPAAGNILAQLSGREDADERRLNATTAYEAMSEPAVTIEADRPISEAARVMVDAGVNRLPVVVDDCLAGIVSRADLVRAFIRPDVDIQEELLVLVAAGDLQVSPAALDLAVDGGQVTVTGRVDSAATAARLEASIRHVPGVVSVDCSGLTWPNEAEEEGSR
jgi:CBS domain-containing protein